MRRTSVDVEQCKPLDVKRKGAAEDQNENPRTVFSPHSVDKDAVVTIETKACAVLRCLHLFNNSYRQPKQIT